MADEVAQHSGDAVAADADSMDQRMNYLAWIRVALGYLSQSSEQQQEILHGIGGRNGYIATSFDLFDEWENARGVLWAIPLTEDERLYLSGLLDALWSGLQEEAAATLEGENLDLHAFELDDLNSSAWRHLRSRAIDGQVMLDRAAQRLADGTWREDDVDLPEEFRLWA